MLVLNTASDISAVLKNHSLVFMSPRQRNKPNACFHSKKYNTVETKFYMQLVQICLKYTTGLSLSESVQKLHIT